MEKEIKEKYLKAGKIAAQVRETSRSWVKPGAKLLNIAEKIENLIIKKGAEPAFPVNISLNEAAAHYTPYKGDETSINKNDVVKIDIGVHIDGYVGDTAYTVAFNKKHDKLIKASEDALAAAIKLCIPGMKLSKIGETIESTIKKAGFLPIANLTGHGLDKNNLHAEPQIPNIKNDSTYELKEDQVIAIEPFASMGSGRVKESEPTVIYMLIQQVPVRSKTARIITGLAMMRNGLPFAERWIPIESRVKIKLALRELMMKGALHEYPVLKDTGLISQAEHTLIVGEKPLVTTMLHKKPKKKSADKQKKVANQKEER
jgi:methionyl aminopeptidase